MDLYKIGFHVLFDQEIKGDYLEEARILEIRRETDVVQGGDNFFDLIHNFVVLKLRNSLFFDQITEQSGVRNDAFVEGSVVVESVQKHVAFVEEYKNRF